MLTEKDGIEFEQRQRCAALTETMGRIAKAANGRPFTNSQRSDFDAALADFDALAGPLGLPTSETLLRSFDNSSRSDAAIAAALDKAMHGTLKGQVIADIFHDRGLETGDSRMLRSDQKVADYVRNTAGAWMLGGFGGGADDLQIGRLVRGAVTGDWSKSRLEAEALRDMSIGLDTGGGYLLPSPLSARIIDLARNQARVFQAGAITIPMESTSLDMARITGGPTAYWKQENAAVTASDLSFGRMTFTARMLMAMAKVSIELIEDAANLSQIIEQSLSQSLALELDRVALRGSGVGAEPLGILGYPDPNNPEVTNTVLGTGSGAQATQDDLSRAIQVVAQANGTANALIWSVRTAGAFDRMKDGQGLPVQWLPSLVNLKKLSTNQVPTNLTVGGSGATCSEIYVGDFSQLAIGMRTSLILGDFPAGGRRYGQRVHAGSSVAASLLTGGRWPIDAIVVQCDNRRSVLILESRE